MKLGSAMVLLLLVGCAAQKPTPVVRTPSVCPAPRAVPDDTLRAIDGLPDELPPLDPTTDAAQALFALGANDAALYGVCVNAARGAAAWIRNKN